MKNHTRSNDHKIEKKKSRRVFTIDEDQALFKLVQRYGDNDWGKVSLKMNDRSPRQCKERWSTYLNPFLNKTPWTDEEEQLLKQKVDEYGPKWSKIAQFFAGRPDNCIKNHWNAMIRKEKRVNDLLAEAEHNATFQYKADLKCTELHAPQIYQKVDPPVQSKKSQVSEFQYITTINNRMPMPVRNTPVHSNQDQINLLDINSLLNL